jgi:YrbI family 3-deoxy-D-manno-octulosonate 8-phosphate phosphatase
MAGSNLTKKMAKIKLFASDVDGVLTDSGMYYSESGDELKKFNTRDGGGFWLLRSVGIKTALITSESVDLVKRRARKLQVDHLRQVTYDKLAALNRLMDELNLKPENVSYIGDDINDLTILEVVGLSFAVADAVSEVRNGADVILDHKGGDGAVREAAELLLKTTGRYDEALRIYMHQKEMEQ